LQQTTYWHLGKTKSYSGSQKLGPAADDLNIRKQLPVLNMVPGKSGNAEAEKNSFFVVLSRVICIVRVPQLLFSGIFWRTFLYRLTPLRPAMLP